MASGDKEGSMTARDEVLAAARRLSGASPDGTFTIDEVLSRLREEGTAYAASTIRTHVSSRMCANAPDHHAIVYHDLFRVSEGRYRLARPSDP
jgi:hypothetical protein